MASLNIKNLHLNLLVVFEAVYSTGNISRAADRLAMSQPAVSNALARLRDLLGDPLFVRAKRDGVEPTTKAKAIIGPVREALGLIGAHLGGAQDIDLTSLRRTFHICTMDTLEPLLVPPLLNIITARAPGITIENVVAGRETPEEVAAGTLDIAFHPFPSTSPQISIVPVGPTDPVGIARRDHPIFDKPIDVDTFNEVGQVALSSETRGLTQVDRDLLMHNMKRRIVMAVARLWSSPAIVQDTDLIAILPRAFARYVVECFRVRIFELPVPIAGQPICMMWNSKMDGDPAHRWLRDQLLKTATRHLVAPAAFARDATQGVAVISG